MTNINKYFIIVFFTSILFPAKLLANEVDDKIDSTCGSHPVIKFIDDFQETTKQNSEENDPKYFKKLKLYLSLLIDSYHICLKSDDSTTKACMSNKLSGNSLHEEMKFLIPTINSIDTSSYYECVDNVRICGRSICKGAFWKKHINNNSISCNAFCLRSEFDGWSGACRGARILSTQEPVTCGGGPIGITDIECLCERN